jgi:hypothetical protein
MEPIALFGLLCKAAGFPAPADWNLDEGKSPWLRAALAGLKENPLARDSVRDFLVSAGEQATKGNWELAAEQLAEARQTWFDMTPPPPPRRSRPS